MASSNDINFAKSMIKHHEGAVKMGEKEIKNGSDKEMVGFAKKVVADQSKEIGMLKAFVKENGSTNSKKSAPKMKM